METSELPWSEFEREWTKHVIASVNKIRGAAGLTVKDLAHRLKTIGWPVSDATLSGVLSGGKRSSISIAEVTAFARALNVSPLYFILGLPETGELPPAKLWGPVAPKNHLVAEWFTASRLPAPYPGDVLSRKDKHSAAYIASIFAAQGLDDLLSMANMSHVIRWQAAQLVAFERFSRSDIEEFIPEEIWSQGYLWQAIGRLSAARHAQRKLDPDWRLALSDLPDVLQFIEAEPIQQREDFTIEELTTLAPPDLIERAEINTRELIESRRNVKGEPAGGSNG